MSEDIFRRYGRAVYEADRWCRERDSILSEIQHMASSTLEQSKDAKDAVNASTPFRKEYRQGGKYCGILKEVAAQCGVSTSMINDVISGRSTSARISSAVAEAEEKRDRQYAGLNLSPLTAQERLEFQHGGKYRGILRSVADDLGLSLSAVGCVLRGKSKNNRVITSLRSAMAHRDDETSSGGAK